jgi:tRNA 2-thiouridine synthesizing protein B
VLHIVNKSALTNPALGSALRLAESGALLLIEDGVYAEALGRLRVYALGPDLEARGVADRVLDGVTVVDYGGFVDLVAEHPNCQSWL